MALSLATLATKLPTPALVALTTHVQATSDNISAAHGQLRTFKVMVLSLATLTTKLLQIQIQ